MGAPQITITYCTQCNWLLRANWMAAELLSTFGTDLGSVTLRPGTGGIFVIEADGEQIWERKRDGGFPDAAELKRRVRDSVLPDWSLGHADRTPADPDAG
ncbi:SelT/SelW/SelH family protein [Gordonia sp. N1V]|uniref:SelT/SelW/SelH family protein n=1 Tax=Gordonia sp. N1V TaxID=3034163 RepID=UPI0023E15495|nr:SelT/SelW/SelH family protein [Gordonia sp. N1V]MDF3283650.1 SelT/SelW/SelH family protein [Gordonia sp. N1V]